MKFCVDCKHYKQTTEVSYFLGKKYTEPKHVCIHPNFRDLVTGAIREINADTARAFTELCGRDGELYEART